MKPKLKKSKEDLPPLYFKGDLFRIVKRNYDERLMPLEAMRLRDKNIYSFEEDELEDAEL